MNDKQKICIFMADLKDIALFHCSRVDLSESDA